MYGSKSFVIARNIARKMGITKLIQTFFSSGKYESAFDSAMEKSIQDGDVIYDIGANIGYYSKLYAEKVGTNGRVFAFEPDSQNFSKLLNNIQSFKNITPLNIALGDNNGSVTFQHGTDDLGATSKVIADNVAATAETYTVEIFTLDSYVEKKQLQIPNVIKIDTESFEYEIIKGMYHLLSNNLLRVIGMEIHFKQLNERGIKNAPDFIVAQLKKQGFAVRWTDASHLLATRKS